MLGGFGSLASGSKPGSGASHPRASSGPYKQTASNTNAQSQIGAQDDGDDSDPDLPPGMRGAIDKETYLRMRDEFDALKRGIEPGRPFDPGARGRAIERMEGQESELTGKGSFLSSLAISLGLNLNAGATWTAIGPAPLGNPGSSVSGRVTTVVVDPANSNIVYLGAAQGGVWRSLDGGITWTSIFDSAQSMAIGALALAPSDHTILYVGTGEFNGCGSCFFGAGLYRIDNADTSATLVGPINPSQTIGNLTYNIFSGRSISKILVHPTDPNTIFVATGSGVGGSGGNQLGGIPPVGTLGVYRSTNATAPAASVTFQKLVVNTDNSFDNPPTGSDTISDMVMEPGNPDHILVGVIGFNGSSSGVYQCTNALAPSPTFIQTLALPLLTTGKGIRVQLAINKVGSTVTAYAATSEVPTINSSCAGAPSNPGTGAVRKSIDGGASWSAQLSGGQGFCSGQCFYDMPIAVDPNDADVVYIGGQTSGTCGRVVGKSIDGGNSFASDSSGLHADDHSLFFDGVGNIYTGNDGGVWKRSSSSAAGSAWTNLNNAPLSTLQFESVAVHPIDRNITIGGTQDNGTELQQTTSGSWTNSVGGDGGYTLIDQSATDNINVTMYHTFFFNGGSSGTQIEYQRASTVGGGWTSLGCFGSNPHNGINCTDNVLFYSPMALGPGSPNPVYLGSDRLYRSADRGTTNTVVSQASITNPGGAGTPISSIAIAPQDDNYRLVGMQTGRVFATSTGSSTLVEITGSFPTNPSGSSNRFVGRAIIDPSNKDVAYVAFSFFAPAGQGVWKITNLGAAAGSSPVSPVWTAAGNGIPSIPINAFAVDPANSNNLFAGTDIGVYYSTDGGANWAPFGTGLPRAAVFDMKIQDTNRILRVATHGRGMWEISIGATPPPTVRLTATDFPVNENVPAGFVTVSVFREGDATSAASVNYATSDTAGLTVCSQGGTGKASERCDYATSLGTLSWAAGEAGTKSFNIPIINDAIVEGNEVFNVTLSNPIGVSLGTPSTATVTILDDDSNPSAPNPIDGVDFFITQQYIDFLGRMPDQGGFTNWQNTLAPCPNGGFGEPPASNCDRLHVAAGFLQSAEFLNRGYFAFRFYMVAYHQPPTYAQFIPDMAQVGGSKSLAEEEAAKVAFANAFVLQSSFTTKYPSLSGQALAEGLLQTAGLPAGSYNAGAQTNGQILRGIAESQAALDKFLTEGTVSIQYFAFLRRDPDTIGYQNNVTTLNANPSNLRHMIFIFIYSSEYRGRFGTP